MRNDLRYDIDLHQVKRQGRNVCLGSVADIATIAELVRFVPIADTRRPSTRASGNSGGLAVP